ncbi:kelch-like protein 10 [Oppia nitens]|uniref:kelch-like protein 10 n=1 Tax=Oppia nitens TaxID=1686743 RepID=UPI0023DA5050|nr:kelch-like protein 10 [Oppia nitens]
MSVNPIKWKTKKSKTKKTTVLSKKKSTKSVEINFVLENSNDERKVWMEKLFDLQRNAVFVDSNIVTSDFQKFPIDRNLFAAISPYFMALYSNELYSENQNQEVFLPDISSEIIKIIIHFVYTGQLIGINDHNIEALIQAVNRLQINGATDYCYEYWIKSLNIKNCIRIYQMSRILFATQVIEKSKEFILYNFTAICTECPDFYSLNRDELADLLSDDRLNVSREEFTYSALISWISANNQRVQHFDKLLKMVRFGNSSLKFVESTVRENILVKDNQELSSYMNRVYDTLSDIHANPLPSKFDIHLHPFLRPRIPRDILFVFGGWSASNAINNIETYDCRVNKWYNIDNQCLIQAPYRSYHGLLSFNGLIYVIGGFDGRQHFNTVFAFNPLIRTWSEKSCMHTPRCYVSVAVCDGFIYAMGGFDGSVRTSSAERYDVKTNQWQFIAHMNHARSDASATSMGGKVFIVGGFNGSEVLRSAELYDPETNEWTLIVPMNTPRSGVQLVSYANQYLFAIGGNDGNTRQTSIEKYDTHTKSWTQLTNMSTPRSNFACAVLENIIYVIGGFNGTTTIAEVESYNPVTNSWQEMWRMGQHKSALSACVVSELSNSQIYTWLRRELNINANRSQITTRRPNATN